jgi:hypothetical protein
MTDPRPIAFPIVDALRLDASARAALLPAPHLRDASGGDRTLPRYFYEIPSWDAANQTQVAEHFALSELMRVDVREAPAVRDFPRFLPCAITTLAVHLELFRRAAEAPVYVAANGGYRSPAHRSTRYASTHCWGTAANIYRIGDEYLDEPAVIEKWTRLAERVLPGVWTRPYGPGPGHADDHLHIDLGFIVSEPRAVGDDTPVE